MAKRASYHWLYLLSNLLVFGVIWYGVRNSSTAAAAKQVPYGELLTDVRAGDVSDVRIG
jgi:hypothetical protein